MIRARAQLPFLWQKATCKLLRMSLFPQLIPAGVIASSVFLNGFLWSLQWIMRCIKRSVKQKRFVRRCFIKKVTGKIDRSVRCIERPPIQCGRYRPLFSIETKGVVTRKEIRCTREVAPIPLETEIRRLLGKMPFSHHCRKIVRVTKHLSNSCPS